MIIHTFLGPVVSAAVWFWWILRSGRILFCHRSWKEFQRQIPSRIPLTASAFEPDWTRTCVMIWAFSDPVFPLALCYIEPKLQLSKLGCWSTKATRIIRDFLLLSRWRDLTSYQYQSLILLAHFKFFEKWHKRILPRSKSRASQRSFCVAMALFNDILKDFIFALF